MAFSYAVWDTAIQMSGVTVYVQRKQFAKFVPRISYSDVRDVNGYCRAVSQLRARPSRRKWRHVDLWNASPHQKAWAGSLPTRKRRRTGWYRAKGR